MHLFRLILAFLAAMALAIFAFPLGACAAWLVGVDRAGGSCSGALGHFAWYGSAVVVPATLLFGVPLLILAYRRSWLRWWQLGLLGAAVGVFSAIGLDLLDNYLHWYRFMLLSAPLGFAAGVLFWLIALSGGLGPNNSFKPNLLRKSA